MKLRYNLYDNNSISITTRLTNHADYIFNLSVVFNRDGVSFYWKKLRKSIKKNPSGINITE